MAIVGLSTRVFYREQPTNPTSGKYWEDSDWSWVGNVKSVPNPFGEPNMVDTSGLEDWIETQIEGRRAASDFTLQLPFDRLETFMGLEKKNLDVVILYGQKGNGEAGKFGLQASVTASPDEAGAEELTCSVKFSVKSIPTTLKDYTVVVTTDEVTKYPTALALTKSGS